MKRPNRAERRAALTRARTIGGMGVVTVGNFAGAWKFWQELSKIARKGK